METPADPATFKQAQGITNRIVRETERDYSASFSVGVETMHAAEFLTDTEREEMMTMVAQQSELAARMPEEDAEKFRRLPADDIHSTLEHVQGSITSALRFNTAANQVLEEVKGLTNDELTLEQATLIRHLRDRKLPAFESMVRWNTLSHAVLKHAGIVLDVVGVSISKLMPQDQPNVGLQSRLGTTNLLGLDRDIVESSLYSPDKEQRSDVPQRTISEHVMAILRDRNIALGEIVPEFTLPYIRAYRSWQKARQQVPTWLESFTSDDGPEGEDQQPPAPSEQARAETNQLLQQELRALIAAHTEQVADFRPPWAQLQRHGLRPFYNTLRQMGRAGALVGISQELPSDEAKRLTGLLHTAEVLGQDPATLRERLVSLVHDEYITQVNIHRILAKLRNAGTQQAEPDWRPVTRDFDLLLANWKVLEPKILKDWASTQGNTPPNSVTAINTTLKAFRKARFEASHPELRLKRIAKPLGAVALPPDARPEQPGRTSSRENQAVSDTLQAIAASELINENKRMRAKVISHFVDLAELQRQEGDEGFGDLRFSDPIDSGKLYYTVRFRSPHDNSEWNLLESFEPETATYVIPQRLVDEYGDTLREFVQAFGKEDQRTFGSIQVFHVKDWTPEDHIERIMQKIKPEKSTVEAVNLDATTTDERA